MKKMLLIALSLSLFALTGCSKADVEKQPVVIGNTTQLNVSTAPETSPSADVTITPEDQSMENAKGNEDLKVSETRKDTTTNTVDSDTQKRQQQAEAAAAVRELEKERQSQDKPKESSEAATPLLVEVEGIKETVPGKIYKSADGFEITYDAERFKHTTEGNVDSFAADNADPAIYPYIYMNISQVKDTTAKEYSDKIITESETARYQNIETTTSTIGKDYDCTQITLQAGREWNSVIRNYYIIDTDKTLYLIETQYFVDAEEGYGARIQAMLSTFYIP